MSIKKAFSLIEVLIFITILSLFLITAAAIITVSMRQNTLRTNQLKATHYNEQLLEWIRSERDVDWNAFILKVDKTYCFSTDTMAWTIGVVSKDLCTHALGGYFRRYVVLSATGSPASQVEVLVKTEWVEAGNSYSTNLNTILTLWE